MERQGATAAVAAKEAARRSVDAAGEALVGLSHTIHAHPEVAFEEEMASAWVAEALELGGFSVQTGAYDLPTALVATAGSGPLTVAICAEYDALPRIGHACGHNIIAAAAVGAGLALAPLADDLGLTVRVLGTPAEEGGGGKILMLERGAFAGVKAAMMVHPSPVEADHMPCLAVAHLDVAYSGKEAHASAFPERGVNAADALTVAQVAIGLLRQHFGHADQVHGIVVKGGDAPNVVPSDTWGKFLVRASDLEALAVLEPRIRACFEAGALATGCQVEISLASPRYSQFQPDQAMMAAYRRNAEALGRPLPGQDSPSRPARPADTARPMAGSTDAARPMAGSTDAARPMAGSTDMANVSMAVPSIHPMLGIDSGGATNHQAEFTAACVTASADQAVTDGALAMAWTMVDLATDADLRSRLVAGP